MNVYILVEGKQTERKVYPAWLSQLASHMKQVESHADVEENSYFLLSGEGYPRLLDVSLKNSLNDIAESGKFDAFWIVLDSDGEDIRERINDIYTRIASSGVEIGPCSIEIIMQNPCIETWGLGNKSVISVNQLHGDFNNCYHFYDVATNDPELMTKPEDFIGTIAHYHEYYIKNMYKQVRLSYSKNRPVALLDPTTLEQIVRRLDDTPGHLSSFKTFHLLATKL
ncbi:RloB family protein [Raoultella planticola]|uniref:RloB family protein n=1 Tax=Raoultella planticola TaxID=575 RepID=UPI001F236A3E|nr:RloB family protein [Raoultella planticola]MCE9859667.1 RloB family protein [Raoultella planticola]